MKENEKTTDCTHINVKYSCLLHDKDKLKG